MSLAERRSLRLFTFCALYVAQGMPWGFMATTLPAYLTKRGLDEGFVGAALAFTTLPYAFKWIWGPIIDMVPLFPRWFGRRRPWIIFAQLMMAATVAVLVAFDLTREVKLLAWMVLIHTVFNSLQDVATDALAVELLDPAERGRANGFMYACKYAGGILGGAGLANLINATSMNVALVVQTAILLAIMMVPLFVSERSVAPPARPAARELFVTLARAFTIRSALVTALLMLGINLGVGIVNATGNKLFVGELGWDYHEYADISGGWGLAVGAIASAGAGLLVDRLGRRQLAALGGCLLAVGWIAFALARPLWTEHWFVYAAALYGEACVATMTVGLLALCMDLSWPQLGGTQFAAYMAFSNFSTTLGYQVSAHAMSVWEFHGVYLFAAGCQLVILAPLLFVDPTELARKMAAGHRTNWPMFVAFAALVIALIGLTVYKAVPYL